MKISTSTSFVVATLAISSSSLAIPVADGPPQSPKPDVSATNSPRSAHTEQISQFAGRSPALRSGSGRRRSLPRRRSSHGSISKRQVPGAADPVTQPVSGGIVAQTLTGLGLNIFGARATPPSPPVDGAPQPPPGAPAPPSGAPAPQGAPSPPGGAPPPAAPPSAPPQGAPAPPQGAPSPPGSAPAPPTGAPAPHAGPPAAPAPPVKARGLPDPPVSIIMSGGQVAQVPLSTLGSLLSGASASAVPGPGAEIIQVITANGDAIPFSVAKGPLAAALSSTPLNARSVPPTPNGTPDMASLAGSIVDVVTPNGIIPVKLPTDAVTNVGSGPAGQVVQVVGANGELIPIPLSEIVAGAAPAPVKPLAKGAPHVGPRGVPDITGKLPAPAYQIIEILGPDGPVPFKVPTSMLGGITGAPGAVTGMVGQVPGALPFGAVGGLTGVPGAVTGMVGQMSGSLPAGGLTGGMVGNTAGTVMGSLPVPEPVNPAQMMPGMFGGLQENPNGAEQPAASSTATVSPAPSDASSCTTCTDSSGPSPTMSSTTDGAPTSTPTGQVAAVVGPRDGLPLPAGMAAPTAPTPGDVPPLVQ